MKAGRSGNPLLDLASWYAARTGSLDVRWLPHLENAKLSAFVDTAQTYAEVHPIAGITDGAGFSLPGRDGQALDHGSSMLLLSRALHMGTTSVKLPVKRIPAPAPIKMASPDGALFAGTEEETSQPPPPPPPTRPQSNDHCYSDPPQRPFCDGPRNVPEPYGAALDLARSLSLGELGTVSELTRRGPKAEWTRAAGHDDGSLFDFPVQAGKVGRGYGYVRKGDLRDRIHPGIDIVAPAGTPIVAASPAIVAYSDNHVRGYGNLLLLVHPDGTYTLYAHCQRILVFAGQRVERGQQVAEVGMTGLAMGPHLHFEYHDASGSAADPMPHLLPVAGQRVARVTH
ncbi:MAG: M23 family metallopeptidase [Myxococcales bacterium]